MDWHRKIPQFLFFIAIFVLLVTTLFFRFYQIGQVPPGLFGDEATHALDALNVLDGKISLYTPGEGSTGTLWRYLLALNFSIFGASIFTLRAFAAAIGILSVLLAYLVIKEIALTLPFSPQNNEFTQNLWSNSIAIVTALLLTTSYWHVDLSRIAFSAILMLLAQDLTFFFLWRALGTGKRIWFALFGLSLGAMAYHYLPGKLVPIVPLAFFLLEWLISRRDALLTKYWRLLLFAVCLTFVVALPLGLFLLLNYEEVTNRAMLPTGAVASLTPVQAIIATLARFGLWPTFWVSGQWNNFFVGPLLTIFFVAGAVTSLIRFKKPNHLFLLVWWGVMILPGVLASEGIPPHARRAIGAATPTFALVALGLAVLVLILFRLIQKITRSTHNFTVASVTTTILAAAVLAVLTGNSTYKQYFIDWGTSEQARLDFHVYDLELAEIMALETGEETVYLLPLDSSAGIVNPVLDNITFVYKGQSTFDFLPDDEQTLPENLSRLTDGKQQVRLLRWKVSKHTGADPKNVTHYYLEQWGDFVERKEYQYFDIDTYKIADGSSQIAQTLLQPTNVNFEDKFTLTDYGFGSITPAALEKPAIIHAGELLWAELVWQKVSDFTSNYQAGLWLEDEAGHVVARADKLLLSNIWHKGTEQWAEGAKGQNYFLLNIDPTIPPGKYLLKTVLYQSDTGKRLSPLATEVGGDLAVTLGAIDILPPDIPAPVDRISAPQQLEIVLENGLQLIGIDTSAVTDNALQPGSQITLRLWGLAAESIEENVGVLVSLTDNENIWLLSDSPQLLGNNFYPTREWKAKSPVQTFMDVRIPAEITNGNYNLGLRFVNVDTMETISDLPLGPVQIEGRTRNFEAPPIKNKLETNYDNQITLLGYDLDLSQIETEGVVRLTLYWQAQQNIGASYKIFVHFMDEENQIIAQVDQEPRAGAAPTSGWVSGEVVTDIVEVPVNENLVNVSQLGIGLYNPINGKRLPVLNEGSQNTDIQIVPLALPR